MVDMSFFEGLDGFDEYGLERSVQIDKKYILSRYTQEEIFQKVFPLKISLRSMYKNPLRNDGKAGCRFYYTKSGVLTFHDLSRGIKYDCFSYMQQMYNASFQEVINMIANDTGIINDFVVPQDSYQLLKEKEEKKEHTPIQIKRRKWNGQDVSYWYKKYGIKSSTLKKFDVHPVEYAWYGRNIYYRHDFFDPCYAYRMGKYEYKLYFPFRKTNSKKHLSRFLCNTSRMQGYLQLPDKMMNILCLTKSMKEVMCLYQHYNIPAVAKQGEGMYYSKEEIEEFKSRAKFVFTFLDFEPVGIKRANQMKREYNIPRLFLTDGSYNTKDYGSKDLSDYIDKTKKPKSLIKDFKIFLKQNKYEQV